MSNVKNIQDEKFLSELLRKEISEVKECFNKYSYQSLVICAAIIVFVFNGLKEQPLIAISLIPAIILLMRVIRIGLHKYATANRNSGYELYLSRIDNLYLHKKMTEKNYIILKNQKWEELLRAWRIVQSIIFENIYYTEDNIKNIKCEVKLKRKLFSYKDSVKEFISNYKKKSTIDKYKEESYPWFDLEEITHDTNDSTSSYHCGSYLKEMFSVLFLMQYIMLFIMFFILILKWCTIGSILTVDLTR